MEQAKCLCRPHLPVRPSVHSQIRAMSDQAFTETQKQYLAGLAMGADVARAARSLPILAGSGGSAGTTIQVGNPAGAEDSSAIPAVPERIAYQAQQATEAAGKQLCKEEQAKSKKNPLDMWDEIAVRSAAGEFPKGTDVFLTKFHGLFYVAPAQDAYMCRMRIPGGELYSYQLEGVAQLAEDSAGGYVDITTRANLQLREIPADRAMNILYGIRELGIISLGAGGDNIRNVTASPLSGLDPHELIETLPIAKRMHHYICQHRELYGLPRKFNIAFDGGGKISSLDDTNDIGFHAVKVPAENATADLPEGVYFQLTLGGITGHRDFARDTGICVLPDEVLDVAGAIVRVFVRHGDRTNRKKARLKYVLDAWGFEKFLTEVEQELGHALRRVSTSQWTRPDVEDRSAHVDFHPQAEAGLNYVGVVLPVGRMTSAQAAGVAEIARRFGSGRIRLTVWQNLLIPDIRDDDCDLVRAALTDIGLDYRATAFRAGLVACTGKAGCKFAAASTKQHALQIAEHLENRFVLDAPINIHLTGCHHSCAQHYIGDIGLIATNVEVDEEMVEGYDIFMGGGWGDRQQIARLVHKGVAFDQVPEQVGRIVERYLAVRNGAESFADFAQNLTEQDFQQFTATEQTDASAQAGSMA